jgi:hypothetical protein
MSNDQGPLERNPRRIETTMMDSILYDGVDPLAARRAHMRDVTMARQAAERRFAQRGSSEKQDGSARLMAAKERAAALRLELERIYADDRRWQREHGEDVSDLPDRGRRKAPLEKSGDTKIGELALSQMSSSALPVKP